MQLLKNFFSKSKKNKPFSKEEYELLLKATLIYYLDYDNDKRPNIKYIEDSEIEKIILSNEKDYAKKILNLDLSNSFDKFKYNQFKKVSKEIMDGNLYLIDLLLENNPQYSVEAFGGISVSSIAMSKLGEFNGYVFDNEPLASRMNKIISNIMGIKTPEYKVISLADYKQNGEDTLYFANPPLTLLKSIFNKSYGINTIISNYNGEEFLKNYDFEKRTLGKFDFYIGKNKNN